MKRNIIMLCLLAVILCVSGCKQKEKQIVAQNPRPDIEVKEQSTEHVQLAADAESQGEGKSVAPVYNTYNVTLDVNPSQMKVAVSEKILYKNQTANSLDKIYIKFNGYAFTKDYEPQPFFNEFTKEVYKHGKDYAEFTINSLIYNGENANYEIKGRHLVLSLDTPLPPDSNAEITMQFEGKLPKICHRLGGNDRDMWFGNFIPQVAAYIDGDFVTDEYYPAGDPFVLTVSNFDVTVIAPKEYKVFGTGLEKTTEKDNNTITKMSNNLVRDFAFVVGSNYKSKSIKTESGVTVNLHYFSDDVSGTDKILETADKAIEYFTQNVGVNPYREIDLIETELYNGKTFEFPCVIFVDSRYLKDSSNYDEIVHAVGHQWFDNVVGSDQIRNPWMDEGLISYISQYLTKNENEVERNMNSLYGQLSNKFATEENITLQGDLSVYKSWQEYWDCDYGRASLLFHALYKKMGYVVFDEFLKQYFAENSFKIASKQNMIDCASKVYGESLDDFFESWISWKEFPNLPN